MCAMFTRVVLRIKWKCMCAEEEVGAIELSTGDEGGFDLDNEAA